jgi:lysylphosphatidylglycerol synthetase-like protein (DUF2156 family)
MTQQLSEAETHAHFREAIVSCVRQYGGSSSDAILEPTCQLFVLPSNDALIGYRIDSSCAVVYGDPVCSADKREELVSAFHAFCAKKNLRVIYIITSEEFAEWALGRFCKVKIAFGGELVIDPHDDPKARKGVNGSLVRRKVRHALKEGASVVEYHPFDDRIESAIEQAGQQWLKSREGLQIHTSNVFLFNDREGKRWFYAKHHDKIVGVVVLNALRSCNGWLMNHLMHTPEAPHGTPELLVTTALDTVAKERCSFVTFGSVPSASLGEIVGLNPLASAGARFIFKAANFVFHLEGKMKFWEKFHPESKPSYLLFEKSTIGLKEITALAHALHVIKQNKPTHTTQ